MSNQNYICPKCGNTLLMANKMLHDLKCTEQRPATYENILSQMYILALMDIIMI